MKQIAKKTALALMAIVLCIGMLTGCGVSVEPVARDFEVDVAPDTEASFTLTVAVPDSVPEQNAMKNVAKIFNQTYKNVNVSVITMGSSVASFIQNAYAVDDLPDIFMCSQFDMVKFNSMDIILDLQPFVRAETANGTFNTDDYLEAYWKLGQENFDGDQMMIPRTCDRVVCHYNKKVFAAAGVDMDLVRNGWTWDDFKTVCATLRTYFASKNINSPLVDSNYSWEAMVNPIFEAFGVQYFDDNGKVTVDNENTRKALDFIKDLTDKKYFSGPTGGGADFDSLTGAMAFDSQPLSYHIGRMSENLLPGEKIEDYYDVVTMPVFEGNEKIGAGIAGYAMSATTAHRDYAWKFLKIIAEREGQNALADGGLTQPSVRKDMSEISADNHWTVGYDNYNTAAYTYRNGSDGLPAWDCYTSFFLKVHHMACTDIISSDLPGMVTSYCNGVSFENVVKTYKRNVENHIMLAENG